MSANRLEKAAWVLSLVFSLVLLQAHWQNCCSPLAEVAGLEKRGGGGSPTPPPP